MAESWVQVPPDSTGKRLRSVTHDLGSGDVHSHTTALVDAVTGRADTVIRRTKFDKAGGSAVKYIGVAPMGTSTAAAEWTIFRFLYDSAGDVEDIQALDGVAWGADTAARDALAWSA